MSYRYNNPKRREEDDNNGFNERRNRRRRRRDFDDTEDRKISLEPSPKDYPPSKGFRREKRESYGEYRSNNVARERKTKKDKRVAYNTAKHKWIWIELIINREIWHWSLLFGITFMATELDGTSGYLILMYWIFLPMTSMLPKVFKRIIVRKYKTSSNGFEYLKIFKKNFLLDCLDWYLSLYVWALFIPTMSILLSLTFSWLFIIVLCLISEHLNRQGISFQIPIFFNSSGFVGFPFIEEVSDFNFYGIFYDFYKHNELFNTIFPFAKILIFGYELTQFIVKQILIILWGIASLFF